MYSIHRFFQILFLISFFPFYSCTQNLKDNPKGIVKVEGNIRASIKTGAMDTSSYMQLLEGKRVGVVANQTSVLEGIHLVDYLLKENIDVIKVFSPEHGFRGDADAGEFIKSDKDSKTGLPLISLYGNNKKPKNEQLEGLDYIVFDLQDVDVRFYTYISTLHYVMEACAENNITLLILDRPNPNMDVVDGPIRKKGYESFVGMHPIPVLHGMTIGEYAKMINGEKWLANEVQCNLKVVPCLNYKRDYAYELPIPPSPNLRTKEAIYLYPSLCFFEGSVVSVGRGTDTPFEVFGHPKYVDSSSRFQFIPKSSFGAKHPKLENQLCNGKNLHKFGSEKMNGLNLIWLIEAYTKTEVETFFTKGGKFFDLLAGSDELRMQIMEGRSFEEIKASWSVDLEKFKQMRSQYLIYE